MNFTICTKADIVTSPEKIRIAEWLTDRFGEFVSSGLNIANGLHSTFTRLSGDNEFWEKHIALQGFRVSDDHKVVSVFAHISDKGFAVYDILHYKIADRGLGKLEYYSDIVVSIDDENTCLECKLACS